MTVLHRFVAALAAVLVHLEMVKGQTPLVCTAEVSPGDAAVGIDVVTDVSCKNGGLGCFSQICRFCMLYESPQSDHLLSCCFFDEYEVDESDVPATNPPPPTPPPTTPAPTTAKPIVAPTPTLAPATCTTSSGNIAVGIRIIPDSSCVNGGLGCNGGWCRYCKVKQTPQSLHLQWCTAYGVNFPKTAN